jgi:hypothetical protein
MKEINRKIFLIEGSFEYWLREIGKITNWIAPPIRGINSNPFEFAYVKFENVPQ